MPNQLKTTLFTTTLLLLVNVAFSQSNYYKSSIGIGAGPNFSFTDVYHGKFGYSVYGTFDYNITPYVTIGLEGQYGIIQGGSIVDDPHNRQFKNQYTSFTANFKLMLGELVDYERSDLLYSLRGLYAGFGLGVVNNKMVDIVRYKPAYAAFDPGYGPFPGEDKSTNLAVPLNLGINFFMDDKYGEPRYVLTFNAQSNVTFGEGLDGYNDPQSKFQNNSPDIFNTYTVGIKYFFGSSKAYRKNL